MKGSGKNKATRGKKPYNNRKLNKFNLLLKASRKGIQQRPPTEGLQRSSHGLLNPMWYSRLLIIWLRLIQPYFFLFDIAQYMLMSINSRCIVLFILSIFPFRLLHHNVFQCFRCPMFSLIHQITGIVCTICCQQKIVLS